jgi:hypothetical protein
MQHLSLQLPRRHAPTLEDKIYHSFGITIPLLEFHEIPNSKTDEGIKTQVPKNDSPENKEDDENELFGEEVELETSGKRKGGELMDIFDLEFTGGQKHVTKRHPFIITR